MRRKPALKKSAVRCVIGNRRKRVIGIVRTATHPNIFITAAIRNGTPLKPAENVRRVPINGVGLRVCAVNAGRRTKSGM